MEGWGSPSHVAVLAPFLGLRVPLGGPSARGQETVNSELHVCDCAVTLSGVVVWSAPDQLFAVLDHRDTPVQPDRTSR